MRLNQHHCGSGRAPVQIGYNRRLMNDEGYITMAPNPEGSVVPWVDVLGAYDENGQIIAVLFSHAAHPSDCSLVERRDRCRLPRLRR